MQWLRTFLPLVLPNELLTLTVSGKPALGLSDCLCCLDAGLQPIPLSDSAREFSILLQAFQSVSELLTCLSFIRRIAQIVVSLRYIVGALFYA